jgi:hypothetical protein
MLRSAALPALTICLFAGLSACVFQVETRLDPSDPAPGDERTLTARLERGAGVFDSRLEEREGEQELEDLEEDASSIVDATIPAQMACGEAVQAAITVENLGSLTWTSGTHRLGAVDDSDPLFGPDPRVYLPADVEVPTGGRHTFSFPLRAPAAAGVVQTDWQMVHEGVRWFGEAVLFDVSVVCSAPPPPRPLPDVRHVVQQVAAERPDLLAASCVEHGGNNEFLHALVDRLRTLDDRWGYNWKRGRVGDLSQDVVDYHYGDGPREGSTDVYIIDVIAGHCGPSPSPAFTDVTQATLDGGTVGRWTSLERF